MASKDAALRDNCCDKSASIFTRRAKTTNFRCRWQTVHTGTLIARTTGVARLTGLRPTNNIEWVIGPAPVLPVGTLWTLAHDTEGIVLLAVGPHPHGFELRLILNGRFLRSRVHRELANLLADADDTRQRFVELGFEDVPERYVH